MIEFLIALLLAFAVLASSFAIFSSKTIWHELEKYGRAKERWKEIVEEKNAGE